MPVASPASSQELAELHEEIAQLHRETRSGTADDDGAHVLQPRAQRDREDQKVAARAPEEMEETEQTERPHEQARDGFVQGFTPESDDTVFPLEKLIDQDFSTVADAIRQLEPEIPLSRTAGLTNSLVLLAEKSPRDVVKCITLLQGDDGAHATPRFRLFRKLDKQPQLSPCGNWHYLRKQIDTNLGWAVSASIDGTSEAPWDEYLGEQFQVSEQEKYESEKCERQVLMLAGFTAGPPESGETPYARLFRALEKLPEQQLNALTSTDLMAITTEFKWNAFACRLLLHKLVWFMAHFLLAGAAMVVSTQSDGKDRDYRWNATDILVLCLVLTNSAMFHCKLRQMRLDGFHLYLLSGWNLCDLSGILALYVACVAHFLDHVSTVESVGSVGLLCNCFSILPLLMPFRMTGLLVRTFVSMMTNPDINGFFVVSAFMLYGFAMAFVVSMPQSDAFFGDSSGGPLVSILTSFEAMLGAFHLSNYQGQTLAFFLLFLFVSWLPPARV